MIVEKLDARMESLAKPIARIMYTMTIPTGLKIIDGKIPNFNCDVSQITYQFPAMGGANARIILFDELGAEIYNSGAQSTPATDVLNPSSVIHLAGLSTLRVTISAAQSAPVVLYVLIYGK